MRQAGVDFKAAEGTMRMKTVAAAVEIYLMCVFHELPLRFSVG